MSTVDRVGDLFLVRYQLQFSYLTFFFFQSFRLNHGDESLYYLMC